LITTLRTFTARFTIAALLFTAAIAHAAAPDADIRASFERYKKAALAGEGAAAAQELDSNTVHYYADLRTAALSAPDIHGMPPTDKLIIVRMRHELSPDQLAAFDGRSVLGYIIGKRWINSAQIGSGEIGKVTVTGSRADAELLMNGKPTAEPLVYRKEKAGWRLDLTAKSEMMKKSFAALVERMKLPEDEVILKMVKDATGRPVPVTVWEPMSPARRR